MARRVTGKGWDAAEAKSRFREVLDLALRVGPQRITHQGRPVAVLVSYEQFERLAQQPEVSISAPDQFESVGDFFRRSPLWRSGLDLTRPRAVLRDPFGPDARGAPSRRRR